MPKGVNKVCRLDRQTTPLVEKGEEIIFYRREPIGNQAKYAPPKN